MRQMEREFKDFKNIGHVIDGHLKEIYRSVAKAYQRRDRVNLFRGLSEPWYYHAYALL